MQAGKSFIGMGLIFTLGPTLSLAVRWDEMRPFEYAIACIVFCVGTALIWKGRKLKNQARREADHAVATER